MSEVNNVESQDAAEASVNKERELLMERADKMGINYSKNIGLETLRERIRAKQEGQSSKDEDAKEVESAVMAASRKRRELILENTKLIRVRISNLNPAKRNWPGEVLVVGNAYIGTIRKFIPYGEVTDNGYHIPNVLYKNLVNRKFNQITTVRDPRTGSNVIRNRMVREFSIEVLPTLTQKELDKLAQDQRNTGRLGDE
jgi:hypothetical protein